MEDWIKKEIRNFQLRYDLYKESEKALARYAFSMVKILNGLSEMQYTQFHEYQKTILWSGMKLFSKYCIEQMDVAKKCENILEKKKIIDDIEEAISEITIVYKEMVDGTGDTDRRVFQSLPIDTNVNDVSPKICAFYAQILKELVTLFEGENVSYEYIPYHTLRNVTETRILFKERKKTGKIVLVYISDGIFEKINTVTVCLLHEAFHVLTKKPRLRKKRALYFLVHMIAYMKQLLFEKVSVKEEIKEELMEIWFEDITKLMDEYKKKDDEDKLFYGTNIKNVVVTGINNILIQINNNLYETVMPILLRNQDVKSFDNYRDEFSKNQKIIQTIRSNLLEAFYQNSIARVAETFMKIYHETYADIACIITCNLSCENYKKTFDDSIQFSYKEEVFNDTNKKLRMNLVAKAVWSYVSEERREEWEKFSEEKIEETQAENEWKEERGYGNIELTEQMQEIFRDYLKDCAQVFHDNWSEIEHRIEFRDKLVNIIENFQTEDFITILAGDSKKLLANI